MNDKKEENPKKSPQPEIKRVVAKPAGPEEGTRKIIKMVTMESD